MKLTTLLTTALALMLAGLLALPQPAEAKRFGGGGNVGKQYNTMPRQSQPPQQTQRAQPNQGQTAAAQRAPQATGAGRWLGPLAGLAAGGLLASLFFGDAFEGLQVMDFALIALLIFGAVMLFRLLRRGQGAAVPAAPGALGGAVPAGATPAPAAEPYARGPSPDPGRVGTAGPAPSPRSGGFVPPAMGALPPQPAGTDQFPYWFDGIAFIDGAKRHFINLQAAWDQGDLREIREYTTPELFAELQRERERLGGSQYTEVVRLQAELLTLQRDADMAVASIRFAGLIRESEQGVAEEFNEIWHVQHPWASPQGDWLIAGIQQV